MREHSSITGGVLVKLIILVALVGMILAGGLVAWKHVRSAGAEPADAEARQAPEADGKIVPTQTLELGEFLVNLQSDDDTLRYLQTEISLVVEVPEDDPGGDGVGHAEMDTPAELPPASHRYARDVAIEVLSSQDFEKLRREPDRAQLKALLQQHIDDALEDYRVVDVLFTAFVMQ